MWGKHGALGKSGSLTNQGGRGEGVGGIRKKVGHMIPMIVDLSGVNKGSTACRKDHSSTSVQRFRARR